VGNNIELARMLGLEDIKGFGSYFGSKIGFKGRILKVSMRAIRSRVDRLLSARSIVLPYGPRMIRTIGIVSGGGDSTLKEAMDEGLDLLITGEAKHATEIFAESARVNVLVAGHYQTETVGVKALGRHITEKFNIACTFIDLPTRV
jgi:putative NIF3 family GTP cyclohydrolase 1 type 2